MTSTSRALIGWFVVFLLTKASSAQLSTSFYATSCPDALSTIQFAVITAVAEESRMGASLLRLHFHDCFVNGCDASVLLDDTEAFTGEKNAPPNINSLRGYEIIDGIKTTLETICPGVVSCADILAVAARDSVVALNGPSWDVALGRRDSTTASFSAVTENLIPPTADLPELIAGFANKGFSQSELVTLYGAHTFGQAKCSTFRSRIYDETNIDPTFAAAMQATCPLSDGDDNLAPLDTLSPILFDNGWFQGLTSNKGLLHSDQQLFNGGSTDAQVSAYAENMQTFMDDFANAMIKMGNLSPLTGDSGQVRASCRSIN